jgi:hypothetical protein
MLYFLSIYIYVEAKATAGPNVLTFALHKYP